MKPYLEMCRSLTWESVHGDSRCPSEEFLHECMPIAHANECAMHGVPLLRCMVYHPYIMPNQLRGNPALLTRSAHGADVHPCAKGSILVMGGYGGTSSTYVWMNDLFALNTERCGNLLVCLQKLCMQSPIDAVIYM